MESKKIELCDNLIRGGGFVYTLSASLKRKERKAIWA